MIQHSLRSWLLLITVFALPNVAMTADATAPAETLVDCKNILKDRQDIGGIPPGIYQCKRRGADPIPGVRINQGKSPGVKSGLAAGFALETINAPENSPGNVHAKATVSKSTILSSCNFPPKISLSGFKVSMNAGSCLDFMKGLFKDKNGAFGGTTNADGSTTSANPTAGGAGSANDSTATSNSCAAESDTTGAYGPTLALSGGSNALVCGGTIPLSNYQISLNPNPTALASTEYGAYYIWFYQKQGTSFTQVAGNPIKLPTHLGDWDPDKKVCNNQVDLGAPIAQMITYGSNNQTIALRLGPAPVDPSKPGTAAVTGDSSDPLNYDTKSTEKFLIIPIVAGVPKIPAECSPAADSYKPIPTNQADITIDISPSLTCEGSAEQCAVASPAPSKTGSCDVVNVLESGTIQTSIGAVNCAGKMLYSVLSRPNLIFSPGTTPVVSTVEGRTAVLLGTVDGSKLYTPTNTLIHLGTSAPSFTLTSGGTLGMTDNSRLQIKGTATINPANANITLTDGGQLLNASGAVLKEIPAGTAFTPSNPILPLALLLGRSMNMPAGYQFPTQPSPYVRLPKDPL